MKIERVERFLGNHSIRKEKLDLAIKKATDKLRSKLEIYQNFFGFTTAVAHILCACFRC